MQFETYIVGRGENSDIYYEGAEISRKHLEITLTADKRLYLVDANSKAGTYLWKNESWQNLKQGFVEERDIIGLGKMKVRVSELMLKALALRSRQESSREEVFESITVIPKRSATTGEILVS